MTDAVVVHSALRDSARAGTELGAGIVAAFGAEPPDATILFASPDHDHGALLRALKASTGTRLLVGSSSAGQFTSSTHGEDLATALALRSPTMAFSSGIGHGLRSDRQAAARQLVAGFQGPDAHGFAYRTALLLTDGLAGHADDLVERLTLLTGGAYQFFGGGAGDDANFARTVVFHDSEAVTDAVVALEILSHRPLGIGVAHGWQPASPPLRVTESRSMRLISLNAAPAVEAFEAFATRNGDQFDRADPLSYFLHHVLGIETGAGFKLRVPLAVEADGSITCAADIPTGAIVRIMRASPATTLHAAASATQAAIRGLQGNAPRVALFFDCVATRLRMGREFAFELAEVETALGLAAFTGCNTYGQIARASGQFSGFHNCTAVVCVLPD